MASESIRFDFLTTGGAEMARQFKNAGDNAAAAARGAAVLQDVIKKLGDKENRTAAESADLARALRLTGDAEDRAAAKALAASIAISKLDESMKKAGNDTGGARGAFAAAAADVAGFGAAADAATSGGNKFKLALAGLNLASGVLEPVMAGIVVAAGGLAAGLASAGAGLGVFGVVAQSNLTAASKAAGQVQTAQIAYNAAVANGTKKSVAYKAEQIAIAKAYAQLSPAQIQLSKAIGGAQNQWQSFIQSNTKGVAQILTKGIGLLPKVFAAMQPFLAPTEKALSGIIGQLSKGLSSGGFKSFISAFASNSGPALTKVATAIGNIIVGIGGILKAFLPTSQSLLSGLDKITAKFREWGTTLSGHTGFQSLMDTFKTETPQAVAILKNLGEVILNVGKAMFGLSSFSNSKLLLQALLPLSGVLASLSKNTDLDRIVLYLVAAASAAKKLAPAFAGIKAAVAFFPGAWAAIVRFSGAVEGAAAKEVIAATATKIWAGAQAVLNAVMDVNPVVLLATAAVALGVAFTVAWKKSATFRDVIKEIGAALLEAGIVIVQADKVIVDSFLSMVGTVLHGAATAFGWVPGLGGLLKTASSHFDGFKATVDNGFNTMIGTMKGWQGELTKSSQTATTASNVIVNDLTKAGLSTNQARSDMNTYTTAVQQNGAQSNAARAARQTLITDLKNAGVNAQTANKLVNQLQGSINKMHGNTVTLQAIAAGKGGVSVTASGLAAKEIALSKLAAGGLVRMGSGPTADDVPAMLSRGEVVVPAKMVSGGAVDHLRGLLPGFAGGGIAGFEPRVNTAYASSVQSVITDDLTKQIQAMIAAIKAAQAAAAGGGKNPGPGGPGTLSAAAIEAAWTGAGGPGGQIANIAQAITVPESGRRPSAVQQGQPYATTGWGLWQITPGNSEPQAGINNALLNPHNNAVAAVAKYRQAGSSFSPWTTYVNGLYRPYLLDQGGPLMPGLSLVYNGTGRPETVLPHSGAGGTDSLTAELRALRAEVRQLTGVAASIPASTGRHVAGAFGDATSAASFRARYPSGGR